MLLLYSGLRRSEATALTWADIDLDDATITVSKGYDFRVTHVALPQALPPLLGHLPAFGVVEHVEAAVLLGAEIIDEDLGDTDDADQQNKNRPGGLPMLIDTFTPHQLRHTFCTLMYFAGVWRRIF